MLLDVIYFVFSWFVSAILRIPLILLGLIMVPIGLLFKKEHKETERPFTQHNTDKTWMWVTLPKVLWIWSNDRDGALGDKRGWWDKNCPSGDSRDFLSMFNWLALRNPANNMRWLKGFSVNMKEAVVTKLAGNTDYDIDDKVGKTGWMWLKAKGPTFNYYTFYGVWPRKKDPTKAFMIRIGHKIKVSHNNEQWETDPNHEDFNKSWKGITLFRISFNKDIS
jgi:hypothetical protein